MRWGSWSYKPLGDTSVSESDVEAGDEKEEGGSPLSMRSSSRRPASESVIPVTASIAAAVFFVLFLFTPRPWLSSDRPSQIRYFGCGNSTADASAAGCRFDAMAYTWVHPKCFDQELVYDFLGQYDWSWYADEQGTQPLNRSDVMGGQHEYVYVTWKYYTTHCTYSTPRLLVCLKTVLWRMMADSLLFFFSFFYSVEEDAPVTLDLEGDRLVCFRLPTHRAVREGLGGQRARGGQHKCDACGKISILPCRLEMKLEASV